MRFPSLRLVALGPALSLLLLSAGGCGSSPATAVAGDAGPEGTIVRDASLASDGPTGGDANDGAPDPVYPAPHPAMPLTLYGGGPLLLAENIVTVTFDNEPSAALVQGFDDTLTQTPFWQTIASGFCTDAQHCIGAGTAGGHVTVHESPTGTIDYTTLDDFVRTNVASGLFPPPTPDTMYALYYPPGAIVGGAGFIGCQDFDAYHTSVDLDVPSPASGDAGGEAGAAEAGSDAGIDAGPTTKVTATYAVMLRCQGGNNELTLEAGHEFIEAATDPVGGTGYTIADQAFAELFYPEVGDLCDYDPPTTEGPSFYYTVQRAWSNASAAAGHNPCVPNAPGEVYFNAAPAKQLVSLKVGQTTTLEVTAFSDAPIADWTLEAVDWQGYAFHDPTLEVSVDQTTVNNGTKVNLSIKLLKTPATQSGDAVFALASRQGGLTHYWPGAVLPR